MKRIINIEIEEGDVQEWLQSVHEDSITRSLIYSLEYNEIKRIVKDLTIWLEKNKPDDTFITGE